MAVSEIIVDANGSGGGIQGTPTVVYAYYGWSGSGTITVPESDYAITTGFGYSVDSKDYSAIVGKGESATFNIKAGTPATLSLSADGTSVSFSGFTMSGIYPTITCIKFE